MWVQTMTFTSVRGWPVCQSVESMRPVVWYLSGGPSPEYTVVISSDPIDFMTLSYCPVPCASRYANRFDDRISVVWRAQRPGGKPITPSGVRVAAPTVQAQV